MLDHLEALTITVGDRPAKLFLGNGPLGLEVVEVPLGGWPRITDLRALFRGRVGRRAAPVLIIAPWGNARAAVSGPTEHNLIEHRDLPMEQVEAVCRKALEADGRHAAIRLLHQLLPQLDTPIPGLRNGGLFAMQELEHGVPARGDWGLAVQEGRALRTLRGRTLIQGLRFTTAELPGPAMLLLSGDRKTAVAVLLDRPEEIDSASPRFDSVSPVSYALAQADREHLDYVMVVAGATLRLYPAKPGIGTGRRGRSETFVEINLDLLSGEDPGYLWLLLSAPALSEGGTVEEILARSEDYAADLGSRLRERVYREVIPSLSRAVVSAMSPENTNEEDLQEAYQAVLRILYRLLFVAYAEDRDLLPLHTSQSYREHSLKRIAQRLEEARQKGVEFGDQDFYWSQVTQIWKAVSLGNPEWDVPAYNGTLFASDAAVSVLGARIAGLSLSDREFAAALSALLLDRTAEGTEGPVDFRSLGIREFGTIYEGLLESELSLAEADLTVDPRTEAYLPAGPGDTVEVRGGEVYLHNRSGARKSSGSYYTRAFAVEHLLDRVLEPALGEHLERLDGMSDREAGRRFFEFRVADIAMGSGHFLVGAVDRIERRLANYLAGRPLPDVREELARLRRTAAGNLGEEWSGDPIEDTQLLRRQVARRCIFGVDMNPMAVELARLSLWIHTFVPGLPLSLLDHNLAQGNSLVGIATFEEASELFQAESGELFAFVAGERLEAVRGPLEKLARLTDANDAEIREARELYARMRQTIQPEQELFTLLTASRTNSGIREAITQGQVATRPDEQGDTFQAQLMEKGHRELKGLDVLHFPLAFPHVFLGSRKGFDVILGNPPWEKPRVEEHGFWARHFPRLRSRPQREQEGLKARYRQERPDLAARLTAETEAAAALRRLLTAGAFPGMGTGDPDLYKAFVWRFWDLVSPEGGRIGVVLPRSALAAKGGDEFRKRILNQAETVDLTMLVNNREWVFPNVHPQYTIGLTAITRREGGRESELRLSGPYSSLKRFRAGVRKAPVTFRAREVETWNDTASLPLLPSDESVEVFAQLRKSPRLDLNDGAGWRARPQTELHATQDKPVMDLESKECPDGFWPVYKGASFDLWTPDTGTYYAWADPERVLDHLQGKRARARGRGAFAEFDAEWRADPETLPCLKPRIAFRDVTRATDSRTIRAALVPPQVFLTHKAPFFVWPRGSESEQAYFLGMLSSLPLDWYARRFVETSLTFFVLNPFPVPRPDGASLLRDRAIALAGRLAAPDDRFAGWAGHVGVECGPLEAEEKEDHIRELDAVAARLYSLDEAQLVHVFETFHERWDYEEPLRATLDHFLAWKGSG